MDLALLGSPHLHSSTVLSRRTNAGAAGGCKEYSFKFRGGSDHSCSVSSLVLCHTKRPVNIYEPHYTRRAFL